MKFPSLYLASKSPRRRELLQQMAVDFAVISPEVDESVIDGEAPEQYVRRIALSKAEAGKALLSDADRKPVLAADTAVVLNKQIFGKPVDEQDARTMLKQLSGQTHQVMTAIALAFEQQLESSVSISEVTFAELSEQQIDWYLQTGEGADKAGGYAVQGLAALFIEQIRGSYSGIMGLPIRETGQLLIRMDSDSEQ
ncbi:Maf family protein [Methylophaga sp. OBS4]|uniref:Maf family protein n=1 Tax=Methylophaga sp. OBS4 TaxID=2991935 RepID=UPI0022548B60|nr:Maf family protein [Methylophaga sp. OBS4]MCX4187587.1 Maf family nucleotide pyrophosphatase [Methylophaga sp. OBS4]